MDLVIRAAVVFAVLWIGLRLTGKREVAQMDAFDLIVLVVLGDLISQGVLQEDYSLVGAITAAAVVFLLSVALSYVSWRFPRSRALLESTPTILLRDGTPDIEAMSAERITMSNLMEAARGEGVRELADVDLVVLEPDGRYSFFTRDDRSGKGPSDEVP